MADTDMRIRNLLETFLDKVQYKEDEFTYFSLFHMDRSAYNRLPAEVDELWPKETVLELPPWSTVSHCYDLLEEIQTLEADRDTLDLQEDKTWEDGSMAKAKATRFLKWLYKNECFTGPIRLQLNQDKNSYEIYTTADVPKDVFLFGISSKVFITTDFVKNTRKILPMEEMPSQKTLSRKIEMQTERIRLALFLIHEKYVKSNGSFWKPYLDVLPRLSSYLDLCTYSKADMELIKESRTGFREAWFQVRSIVQEYSFIRQFLIPENVNFNTKFYVQLKKVITFRRYLWARVRVGSRISRTSEDTIKKRDVQTTKWNLPVSRIIPITDMIPLQGNYVQNVDFVHLHYATERDRFFCCRAIDSVQAGLHLTMLRVSTGSATYFKEDGWIPENYPVEAEMYILELGVSHSDALFERKAEILKRLGIPSHTYFRVKPELFVFEVELNSNQTTLDEVFSFVRLIQGNKELLERVDVEGVDFLKEPIRDSWVYLSTRFKLLEKGAEKTLDNVFRNLKVENGNVSTLSKKQQACIEYLTKEKITLACLAKTTSDQIDEALE